MNERVENKMGTMPVLKLIITMAIPSMLSMLVQSLYNVVDSIFISHYSHAGLEAVTLANPLQMLLISVGAGTGVGINSLVSRRLGAKKFDEANKAATNGLFLSFMSWLLFVIVSLTLVRPFVNLMGADPEVSKDAITYLSIVMTASLGLFIQLNCEKLLQATGNMIYPMMFQLTGAIVNIILDPIFIFTFNMGVAGAAIATVIGQFSAMIFSLIVLFTKSHEVKVSFRKFKPDLKIIGEIYKVGFPSIIMQSIGSVLVSALNALLLSISSGTAVNVFGIYFKLQSFVFMPVFGLNQGVMPIMGYSYGAKNRERLMQALKYGICIAFIIMLIGFIIFMTIPHILLQAFNPDKEMMEMGVAALRIISICFLPASVGIINSTLFQAVGNGVYSMIISILRQLLLVLPCAYILSGFIGVTGVWLAFPVAEAGGLLVSLLLLRHIYQNRIKGL